MSLTWAQGMFLYCGAVIAPAAGFFAARQLKGKGGMSLLEFLVGLFMVWAVLLGGALLARTIHPDYPNVPVSEWLAISYTLPSLVLALFAWRLFPRKVGNMDSPALRRTIALVFLYFVGIAITFTFFTWPYRRTLPWTAHGVRDSARESVFGTDFDYFMRAKLTREEYLAYVQKYGLRERNPATPQMGEPGAGWWHSPENPEISHERIDAGWTMGADFSEGTMHVHVSLR